MSDDPTRLTDEELEALDDATVCLCGDGPDVLTVAAAVESILAARTAALIERAERAERERDEAIDSKDRWRLRAKSAQSELSDIRTTIGSGPERWTEADSISVYRTRAEDAESELAALRAAVAGLADEWEAAEIGVPSPDTALSGNECAADLRALLTDEGDNE